jgi:hypothetical protein
MACNIINSICSLAFNNAHCGLVIFIHSFNNFKFLQWLSSILNTGKIKISKARHVLFPQGRAEVKKDINHTNTKMNVKLQMR